MSFPRSKNVTTHFISYALYAKWSLHVKLFPIKFIFQTIAYIVAYAPYVWS